MDDLDGARRMGREGQHAFGLSVQEQGAYDQGRRERSNMMNWGRPNSGGGGGGEVIGLLFMLAMIAPALSAPGLAMWATWNWFSETQGWDWPVLAAICVAEGVAFVFLFGQIWKVTPRILVSIVLSLYLGISYAVCMPIIMSTSFMWTAVTAIGTAALGFLIGLNAPNRFLSSFILTSIAGIGLGVFLNLFAVDMMLAVGAGWLTFPLKWAGAGLALGAILRIVFKRKLAVLGVAISIGAGLYFAPDLIGGFVNAVIGVSMIMPVF